ISAKYSITSRSFTASLSTEYCAPSNSMRAFFTRTFSGSVFSALSATVSTSLIAQTSYLRPGLLFNQRAAAGLGRNKYRHTLGSKHYSDEGNVTAPGNVLLPGVVIPPNHRRLRRSRYQGASRNTPSGHPTKERPR